MNSVAQSYDFVGGLREAADSLSKRVLAGDAPPVATIVVVLDADGELAFAPSANLSMVSAASLLSEALVCVLGRSR